jgi:hypothetical protein
MLLLLVVWPGVSRSAVPSGDAGVLGTGDSPARAVSAEGPGIGSGRVEVLRGPRPDAYLASSHSEVKASGGLGCWEDNFAGVCACGQPGYLNEPLIAREGEVLLIRFTKAGSPDELKIMLDEREIKVAPTNPAVLPVDVPPGRHYLDIWSVWPQGELAHAAKFDVR